MKTLRRLAAAGLSALFPAACFTALPPMTASAAGTVVINEVCTKNSTLAAPDGQFYDYVELYNTGSSAVTLTGYGLTDDAAEPYAYTFPAVTIPAKGYTVVWCGVKAGTEGASFGLSKNGETVTLTDAGGAQAAQLAVPGLADDTAYGRVPDGSETFAVLSKLTPGSANPTDATEKIAVEAPAFSKESGFYADAFALTLSAKQGCTVYYTTDGSDPDTSSAQYTAPIQIVDRSGEPNVYAAETDIASGYGAPSEPVDKAMIVRAIAVDASGNVSDIITKSYFIGYTDQDFAKNMRVISLVTDPDNLFDYETGIYVYGKIYDDWRNSPEYSPMVQSWEQPANFTQSGREWERPAHITVFESGTAAYSADVGIRIHGGATRSASQKSFNLYARADYGDTKLRYDFFNGALKDSKGKVIDTFDKLTLRNGGNDDKIKIRDRINQEAVANRSFATQAQTECVVFVDGEFWGAYNIVEKLGKEFLADHYNVKEKDVCMIKTDELSDGSDQGWADYEALKQFAQETDFSKAESYTEFCKLVDAANFADYMAAELILGNSDFGNNNYALWKTETIDSTKQYADGKWRFILFDTEYGQGLYGQSNANTSTFQSLKQKDCWISRLFFGLLDNCEEFRQMFAVTYFDLCNENYKASKMTAAVDACEAPYTEIDTATIDRFSGTSAGGFPGWGGGWGGPGGGAADNSQTVRSEFSTVRNFWSSRDTNAKQHLLSYLGNKISNQTCTVTVTEPKAQGTVQLNTLSEMTFTDGKWSGTYPKDCVLTLNAEPLAGYSFVRWEISGAGYESGSAAAASVTILPTENQVTVQAVFQAGDTPSFTAADVRKLQAYLLTAGTLTAQEAASYDLDRSGTLTAADLTQMKSALIRK